MESMFERISKTGTDKMMRLQVQVGLFENGWVSLRKDAAWLAYYCNCPVPRGFWVGIFGPQLMPRDDA
jgi:hypothetical protein